MDTGTATEEGTKYVDDEEDEENVCRICRTPGDENNPLLYPCACRGSIKFVHLECVAQWIDHSNTLQCEVCKHPFSYSPLYAEDAPTRLPFREFLAGVAKKSLHDLESVVWWSYTLSVYLIAVPFVTFWIWRLAFVRSFGEAGRLFLSHISTAWILIDCLLGLLLKLSASVAFFFLGETPLRIFFRHLQDLGGQEDGGDEGDRNGVQGLGVHLFEDEGDEGARNAIRGLVEQLLEDTFTVGKASSMIFPVVVISMPFTLGRVFLYHVSWLFAAAKGPAMTAALHFADTGLSLKYITSKSALTSVLNLTNEGQENGLLAQFSGMTKISGSGLNAANNTLSVAADLLKASAPVASMLSDVTTLTVGYMASMLSDVTTLTVGYMFILILGFLYLGVIALVRYAKGEGEPSLLRQFVAARRHLMTMFRIFLLFIELGVFPLMYGWWLDICTVKMFGKAMSHRVQFLSSSPQASSLGHWVVGFIYIWQSTVCNDLLQEVLRPGVLNFLPDSSYPNEYLTGSMNKLAWEVLSEVVTEGILIAVVVFLPVKLAIRMTPSIFPLDISVSDPFAEIPLFMLMFQVCIPFILEHLRLRSLLYWWFTGVGWALGLTDFLLPSPEDNIDKDNCTGEPGRQVVCGPDMAMAALPATGNPIRSVLPNKNVNMGEEYEDDGEQSTSGYRFMLRIMLLLLAAGVTLLLFSLALIVVPVSLGRALFCAMPLLSISNGIKCSDLNAFVIGTYVILNTISGARYAIELVKSKRAYVLFNQIWKWCGIIFKSSVLLAIWVFIIPVLIGLLFELLVIVPMRVPVDESPVFLLYQDWAVGLIFLKIWTRLDHILLIVDDASWRAKFERVKEDGFSRLQGLWVLREILFPIIMKLLAALCVPYILARGFFPMLGYPLVVNSTVYRFAWISCLSLSLFCFCAQRCLVWFRNLHNSIHDDRYIIGLRLHNFGEATGP